jgi:hypothetical protein
MSRTIRGALAATAVAVCACGAATGAAFASTTSSTATPPGTGRLVAIQHRAKVAIIGRLSALNVAISDVNSNRVISSADKSTLLNTLNGDVSGITALEQKIEADTTGSAGLADYQTVFTGYRVFALALPEVRYAAACDDITGGVLPRLTDAQTKLANLLAGPDKGKDTATLQATMHDLGNQIHAVTASTTGLSATVLAFTPGQWDANPSLLTTPIQTLRAARADVRTGRQDVAAIVAAIKS